MRTIFTLAIQLLFVGAACAQGLPLPYSTGFDNSTQQAGWQQFRTGNDPNAYSWSVAGMGFSAPNCVSHDYNVGANATDTVIDWYVSPAINVIASSQMSLKVRTGGFSTPFNDSFEVLFSSNGADPATANYTLVANLSYMVPQYQWLDTTFSIPFVSGNGHIALKYKTIGAAWSTYAFDNITISSPLSIDLAAGNSTIDMNIFPNPANASIAVSVNDEQSYEIKITDVSGRAIMRTLTTGKITKIDTSDLANGIYFVSLEKENSALATRRLVITN